MTSEMQKYDPHGFAIAALEVENLEEVVADNLSELGRIQFERVKMPSGGGLAFEVTDENGSPAPTAEIVGVIVDRYPVNAYWPDKFGGGNNPPQCSALDGHLGIGDPGGDCAKCRLNQWGSDGEGRGKACKNLHRIYVLRQSEVLPLLVALPPTSLGNFTSYMVNLTSKARKPFWAVLTRIKLEKATSAQGIVYSKAAFSRVGDVPTDQIPLLKKFIEKIRPLMRSVAIASDDYAADGNEAGSSDNTTQPF